ncbi:ATP-binding protein, partial [Actinocorallia lasiicapitis]
ASGPFRAPVTRLTELRLAALEDRVAADLRQGGGRDLASELSSLVAENPLRERLVGALMRALVADGRPAEALTVYEQTREALADELGADPSPELAALHTSILRGETAPRPAPDTRPATNLRAGLTSFVGRTAEIAEVRALVTRYRLTTLTGPGGAGKTRLATEVAQALLAGPPEEVWLVELASLGDGADLAQAILVAMGLRERHGAGDSADRLVAAVRGREVLLVFDNCEHLIGAATAVAARLLGDCPDLRILATSREPLGITGEAVWPVRRLSLP